MIQKQTIVTIADNSGAKKAMVINITGSTRKRYARLGDIVKVAVKKAIPGGAVKKSEVVDAVIVRTTKETRREDGTYIRFDDNAAVIIDKALQPRGTRIFGPVPNKELKKNFSKIISLAQEAL